MALPCQPTPPPTIQKPPSSPSFSPIPNFSTVNGTCNYFSKKLEKDKRLADLCVPVYSTSEVIEKMRVERADEEHPCRAMYSSMLGGIILDPALMVIPIDDHMVHRGHGVFDTAMLVNGHLYDLDSHLYRFVESASAAKISQRHSLEALKGILLLVAAASKLRTGSIRYWLSSGPGDFSLSPPSIPRPTFYSVAIATKFSRILEGVKVVTSTTPMKPSKFATTKNVNYLPNVLSKIEAEEKGAYSSIWIDEQGHIAEGPNANIAFVSKERELVLPKPDKILHGCTAKRLLVLANELIGKGILKSVGIRDISVEEAKDSAEMMFVSSLIPIMPIFDWDGEAIGDGKVGEVTQAISDIFWKDIVAGPQMRTQVIY